MTSCSISHQRQVSEWAIDRCFIIFTGQSCAETEKWCWELTKSLNNGRWARWFPWIESDWWCLSVSDDWSPIGHPGFNIKTRSAVWRWRIAAVNTLPTQWGIRHWSTLVKKISMTLITVLISQPKCISICSFGKIVYEKYSFQFQFQFQHGLHHLCLSLDHDDRQSLNGCLVNELTGGIEMYPNYSGSEGKHGGRWTRLRFLLTKIIMKWGQNPEWPNSVGMINVCVCTAAVWVPTCQTCRNIFEIFIHPFTPKSR